MKLDRLPANKEILKLLDILIRKFPLDSVEEIIERHCFDHKRMIFYEESVETLDRIKKRVAALQDTQEGVPADINTMFLKALGKLIDAVPDQRFGQIYENYLIGSKFKQVEWIMWCDSYVEGLKNNELIGE